MTESSLQFDPARVKRVLLYRLGSLGDTVVALPALHVIERAFPAAQRKLLTNVPVHAKAPAVSAILEGSGLVEGYIHYPMATRSLGQLARVWWQIRRFGPEVLVYMMPPRGPGSLERDVRFFHLCGIRHIVGLPIGDLAASRFDPASGLWEQEAARLLRCVQPLGDADLNDRRWWDLRLTEAEQQKAREVLAPLGNRPMVACGPGTKMQAKDWGQENWRSLLERLSAALPDHALVLVGAPEDVGVADSVAAGWRPPVLQLCGQVTPRETAAVLRRTELFLGPDSGPMHLAASAGVPCAIAFSARDYRGKWYPAGREHRIAYHTVECAVCGLETCIERKKLCLTSITVEEMFAAAMAAWKDGRRLAVSRTS
ncbi:MAG TPA: glycosyltransferase family 9 protein [Terracidiphilus sp.]|nr:glycosyltransferase family 9 protein [Terracidiphilus sp.]